MIVIKITIKDILNGIYRASDCKDVNDCIIAINALTERRNIYPHYHSTISKRIAKIQVKLEGLKAEWHKDPICEGAHIVDAPDYPRCSVCNLKVSL